jgi:membrane-associated phospholipid phosphatase
VLAGHRLKKIRDILLAAARLFARPQRLTAPMVALFAIIPVYLVIGAYASKRTLHSPELALDRAWPLQPEWSLVYVSLFLAALLPVFVVHQQRLIGRVVLAYLSVWLFAYAVFLLYPTAAPAHPKVIGTGFWAVALRTIYDSDVPYNCFPSLHVAQCFLAVFACSRVHRGVGIVTLAWASLVALSTLFTKQHYVADVIGGILLAWVAHLAFLRGYPREATPEMERRLAPVLAAAAFTLYGLIAVGLWLLYLASMT